MGIGIHVRKRWPNATVVDRELSLSHSLSAAGLQRIYDDYQQWFGDRRTQEEHWPLDHDLGLDLSGGLSARRVRIGGQFIRRRNHRKP